MIIICNFEIFVVNFCHLISLVDDDDDEFIISTYRDLLTNLLH